MPYLGYICNLDFDQFNRSSQVHRNKYILKIALKNV